MDLPGTINEVRKLSPKPDDVLLLRPAWRMSRDEIEVVRETLLAQGFECLMFVLLDDSDLCLADESLMARWGWVKAPPLARSQPGQRRVADPPATQQDYPEVLGAGS